MQHEPLTKTEQLVYDRLAKSTGLPVTVSDIAVAMGYSADDEAIWQSIRVHISRLRRKLGRDRIKTRYVIGYILTEEEPSV